MSKQIKHTKRTAFMKGTAMTFKNQHEKKNAKNP